MTLIMGDDRRFISSSYLCFTSCGTFLFLTLVAVLVVYGFWECGDRFVNWNRICMWFCDQCTIIECCKQPFQNAAFWDENGSANVRGGNF